MVNEPSVFEPLKVHCIDLDVALIQHSFNTVYILREAQLLISLLSSHLIPVKQLLHIFKQSALAVFRVIFTDI